MEDYPPKLLECGDERLDDAILFVMRHHQQVDGGAAEDDDLGHMVNGLISVVDAVCAFYDKNRRYDRNISRSDPSIVVDRRDPRSLAEEILKGKTPREEGFFGIAHGDLVEFAMEIEKARHTKERRVRIIQRIGKRATASTIDGVKAAFKHM